MLLLLAGPRDLRLEWHAIARHLGQVNAMDVEQAEPPVESEGWYRRIADGAKRGASAFSDLIFPPVCRGCGRLTGRHAALCPACWRSVRFIERPFCPVLGTPFSHNLGEALISAEAIAHPPPFDRLRSVALYQGVVRDLVRGLKYKDRTDLAPMMAAWMVRAGEGYVEAADAILPVPLHPLRLWRRRFNQAAELSRAIGRQTGRPMLPLALARTRRTQPQIGLGAQQRADNVRGAFTVTETGKGDLFGRRVILVDDVYTTGATVAAVARALRRAGVVEITVLTFARALPDPI
ncbi:ComF family protein [Rhizobium sp. YIM 134829]|uniref:ComF family protein n=1 Tax=Rhizobium sp. YIM 134829 TaxID=3390453 RepID=UPI00397B4F9B